MDAEEIRRLLRTRLNLNVGRQVSDYVLAQLARTPRPRPFPILAQDARTGRPLLQTLNPKDLTDDQPTLPF